MLSAQRLGIQEVSFDYILNRCQCVSGLIVSKG